MLLPKESDALEHLTGPRAGFFQSYFEARILPLEFFDALGTGPRRARGSLQSLHPRLRMQRSAPKGRQLVAKMADELVEVRERRFELSLFVV